MSLSALSPPPLPAWDGIHPLIVHFPIALLLVAPLFVLLGLLPRVGRAFSWAALVLLVLGTASSYVAVESGEAAMELVTRTPEVTPVLEEHAELAETVRLLATISTALYALILCVPPVLRKTGWLKKDLPRAVPVVGQLVVLVGLLVTSLVLANTGHLGGHMVHDLGVRAWFGGT